VVTDAHGLAVIDDARCFTLLGESSIGRLGFSAQALPVIFPVNYVLDHRSIVFSSEPGEKLRAAEDQVVACFEIDQFDAMAHEGWSVLATGRLRLVEPARAALLAARPAAHWALEGPTTFIELPVDLISGRRIRRR
jgi:nitroimidazol reductase NimA-like FMN-containing flavoprotein (pyridoxamine 5'-phosphate oxidase superfamily)